MSLSPAVLDALVAAGATAEMIVAAVKADIAQSPVKQRSSSAERMARKRSKEAENTVTCDDVTSHVTQCDAQTVTCDNPLSLPLLPPQTPPTTPTHTRSITTRARRAVRFDEFWDLYPSKIGKKVAVRSYGAAVSELGGEDPEGVILNGLRRALPGWSSGKFIPNPATWLNQGRWEDEPAKAAPYRPDSISKPAPIDVNDLWRRRVKAYLHGSGFWNTTDWEAQPGRSGCTVPLAVLQEFNITPYSAPQSQERAA